MLYDTEFPKDVPFKNCENNTNFFLKFISFWNYCFPYSFATKKIRKNPVDLSMKIGENLLLTILKEVECRGTQEKTTAISNLWRKKLTRIWQLIWILASAITYISHNQKNFLPVKKIQGLLRSHKTSTSFGEKKLDFCPPLPYLYMSADHLILWIQMTSCFTKQLLPCNLHFRLENSCYLNSSLTGTFCTSL